MAGNGSPWRRRGGVLHRVRAHPGRVRQGGRQAGAARGPRVSRHRGDRAARAQKDAPARAVPKLPAHGRCPARVRRTPPGSRVVDADPRRARAGGAARDDHKGEEKARGRRPGGKVHRVRLQQPVPGPRRAVPAQVGNRDQLQDAKAGAHAHAGPRRACQDLLPCGVAHGAQRAGHAALGQDGRRGGRRIPKTTLKMPSCWSSAWSAASGRGCGPRASRPLAGAQVPTFGICGNGLPGPSQRVPPMVAMAARLAAAPGRPP